MKKVWLIGVVVLVATLNVMGKEKKNRLLRDRSFVTLTQAMAGVKSGMELRDAYWNEVVHNQVLIRKMGWVSVDKNKPLRVYVGPMGDKSLKNITNALTFETPELKSKYWREVTYAHVLIKKMGWISVEPDKNVASLKDWTGMDLMLTLIPFGSSVVQPDVPQAVTYTCSSSEGPTGRIESSGCTGSDGSSISTSGDSGHSQTTVQPGNGPGILLGSGLTIFLSKPGGKDLALPHELGFDRSMRSYGRVYVLDSSGVDWILGYPEGDTNPWRWGRELCQAFRGKKSHCKQLAKAAWKETRKGE